MLLFFYVKPLLFRYIIYWAKKSWVLSRNKCGNVNYWKKQKTQRKNCKLLLSGAVENINEKLLMTQSMTKLCRTLFKYENEKESGWDDWLKTF